MHQKTLFIADHLRGSQSMSELCAEYVISRKTDCKWIERFIRRGAHGLEDRPRHPHRKLPDRSVTCELLKRHGLVSLKRSLRAIGHPGKPISLILASSQIWCADFKGQFRMGNGRYCYSLTVTDGFGRFLLGCHSLITLITLQSPG